MEAVYEIVYKENLPEFLGGTSKHDFKLNIGPWNPTN